MDRDVHALQRRKTTLDRRIEVIGSLPHTSAAEEEESKEGNEEKYESEKYSIHQ